MSRKIPNTLLIVLLLLGLSLAQLQYDGYLQTRKLFLFGPDNGFEFNQFGATHNFLFEREFDSVPRVGLALYTIDFEYSPDFSSRITADTNRTATAIRIASLSRNVNNRLYIMYIATDNEQIGIFVPDRLMTDQLSLPTRTQFSQTFEFNFKQEISQLAQTASDITLTVYLTGLSTLSEMTNNGFPTNRTSISLKTHQGLSTRFYTIEVQIGRDYPFILVDWVECTVVYFIPDILFNNRYQMNSGSVTLKAFGGTRDPFLESVDLLPLAENDRFENLEFFYGISTIECKDGESITLLGVEKYFIPENSNNIRLLLQMSTWKLTFMEESTFNYLQFKSLKCSEPNANCPNVCSDGLRPFFIIEGFCNYCHYSCATCNISNLDSVCDTCHQSRSLNPNTQLCVCKEEFYENFQDYQCQSCFPCRTCDGPNTCTTCLDSQNMVLNTVTSECLCRPGFYANLLANGSYVMEQPCLQCSQNCLYCTNATNCLACSASAYLSNGVCLPICSASERYNSSTQSCVAYLGDQFEQEGRLAYDWSYRFEENEMIIDLLFSQTDLQYYYYENGQGYTYEMYQEQLRNGSLNTDGSGSSDGASSVFFDDGIFSNGFQSNSGSSSSNTTESGSSLTTSNTTTTITTNNSTFFSSFNSTITNNTSSTDIFGNSGSTTTTTTNTIIDQSALLGEFYGLGERTFFQQLYENQTIRYRNQFGIPFGKYKLRNISEPVNANYVDALSRNCVFKISEEVIPYTMRGISGNRFELRTRPGRTYINAIGAIEMKNAALCRKNQTALQITRVEKDIDRFDYYTSSQLSTANSLRDSNETLVDILWGICKYLLFIGLGWPLIPLMLALQYIMSFNYINTPLPLNLDYFLSSFRDFRNPSLLYKPERDDMDSDIFTHGRLHSPVPQLEEFDRGVDFMKNAFQFFFIPFLAVMLLALLALLNLLFRKCCRKDFCLISKFLVPRLPLLIGAYTLIQALPVSFFFFTQLKDITIRHSLEPSAAYPTFTVAMAFLAFFLTWAIPILLLAGLYYIYNYGSRISKFSDANVFNKRFLNKIESEKEHTSRAHLFDPLWGGDHKKTGTYIFGIALFVLAILFGFFLAYFINNFAWQLAGIILFTVLMLVFVVAAGFFIRKIFKIFFIVFFALMLAYLLLHAGLGSNRSINTYDQWNTGYLGIGLLYALLLAALLFSAYLFYRMFKEFYKNHKKYGCWLDIDKENQITNDGKEVERVAEYRKDTKLKSTFLKSGIHAGLAANTVSPSHVSGQNINTNYYRTVTSNVNHVNVPNDEGIDNLQSDERLIVRSYKQGAQPLWEQLRFKEQNIHRNEINFVSSQRLMIFGFPLSVGRQLRSYQTLYVDGENRIYGPNRELIGNYLDLASEQRDEQSSKYDSIPVSNQNLIVNQNRTSQVNVTNVPVASRPLQVAAPPSTSYQTITTKKQIYVINGEEYEKIEEESEGRVRLRHLITGEIKIFEISQFKRMGSNVMEYRSTSHLQGVGSNPRLERPLTTEPPRRSSKIIYANRHVFHNGEQYLDLGYEPSTKEFKLLNLATNHLERVSYELYVVIIEESFKKHLTINGQEYDYEATSGSDVYLINSRTDQKMIITVSEFRQYQIENFRRFKEELQTEMIKTENTSVKQVVVYNGEQYEELGVDFEGKHRLYNARYRKFILISDEQFRNLMRGSRTHSDNLLLLQSAVGTVKKVPQEKETEMKLENETSQFYIFDGDHGSKIYIPKDRIDTEQPIEVDEDDNIRQNGQIIVTKEESRRGGYTKTTTVNRSGPNGYYESRTNTYSQNIELPQTTSSYQQRKVVQEENYEKEEVSAGDVISPNRFYRILGIPQSKVTDFEFKSNDVYLTERNIRGGEVMNRVERIQDKYPDLAVLVKGESDESQEYWLS